MPSATILIANGIEEIEFVIVYDVLIRAGFQVQSIGIGLTDSYANCSRNVKIVPDTIKFPNTPASDILILPGGAEAAKAFSADSKVQSLIRAYRDAGKYIGTICASTTALVASVTSSGKTEGMESTQKKKVTSHPSVKNYIVDAGWDYSEQRVCIDGKIITSRGPGTAMGFALTIVEIFKGKDIRNEIHGAMICAEPLRA